MASPPMPHLPGKIRAWSSAPTQFSQGVFAVVDSSAEPVVDLHSVATQQTCNLWAGYAKDTPAAFRLLVENGFLSP